MYRIKKIWTLCNILFFWKHENIAFKKYRIGFTRGIADCRILQGTENPLFRDYKITYLWKLLDV